MIPLLNIKCHMFKDIGTSEQVEQLKRDVLFLAESTPDVTMNSNAGCWRSPQITHHLSPIDVTWLVQKVEENVNHVINYHMANDERYQKKIENSNVTRLIWEYWMNVNEPGSVNELHAHTPMQWAAVYYIQAEGTGALKFKHPANVINNCNIMGLDIEDVLIHPTDNTLLIWPGWYPHAVLENTSDKQRINLAWNLNLEEDIQPGSDENFIS
jgi:uncharacterized protein (TIGR02466 family)